MNSKAKQEKQKKKKKVSSFLYWFVKITAAIPVLIWLRPKVIYHRESKKFKKKGCLICVNHESFTDPILMECVFWNKTLGYLAISELFNTKLKKFFFTRMHCIPVDRQNFNVNSMHVVCDTLKSGKNIVIFPEGRLHTDVSDDLLEFKGGAPLMAYVSNAPVIPIYIAPTKKWYNRMVAVVGEPIMVRDICNSPSMRDMDVAGEKIREKVIELREYYSLLREKQK